MKKTSFLLSFWFLIVLLSCSKEKSKEQSIRETIVTKNGQISESLINDPLFKKFDKANYEMNLDLLKYSGTIVDRIKSEKINEDLRNHKFKTLKEFAIAKEKIGYTDYHKRREKLFNVLKAKKLLFDKYPELKHVSSRNFLAFYNKNRKHEITSRDLKNSLEKTKDEKKQIAPRANEMTTQKYDTDVLEILNSSTYLIFELSNGTKSNENPMILKKEDFKDYIAIEKFLKFEKNLDSIIFINSLAIEGIKKKEPQEESGKQTRPKKPRIS